jgi:L-seryl-tRNA(Ser) seleniumtransferase
MTRSRQASAIPSVSSILGLEPVRDLLRDHPREVVLSAIRSLIAQARSGAAGDGGEAPPSRGDASAAISAALPAEIARIEAIPLRRVINATGIVVHTNLGRSPLSKAAIDAIAGIAGGYSNLEFDLEKGERSSRSVHVEERLLALTGAECVHVVNNNAAALMLCLAGVARGREVIVSRGELVEIGGSFRIPDLMAESGARLVEVGTTNRTRLSDYERAITPETALLLKVHRSNFTIEGFASEVSAGELSALGKARGVPVLEDLGSGAFFRFASAGIPGTPTVREALAAGADLVTVSGDKLLGGPQAGLIAGRRDLVAPLKKHPLSRAFRVDKLCLAALAATLALYADPLDASRRIPAVRMLTESPGTVRARALRLVRAVKSLARRTPGLAGALSMTVVPEMSSPGGGAMPEVRIATACVALSHPTLSPDALERRLRTGPMPVVARIGRGKVLLDLRTVADDEVAPLADALRRAAASER